ITVPPQVPQTLPRSISGLDSRGLTPVDLTMGSDTEETKGRTSMRKAILGAASVLALASPAAAADLPVTPQVPSYEQHTYEYPTPPPVIVEEAAPVVVRRPVIVAPPVVVKEYPVYAVPRPVYATAPVYAYARPVWHHGWGHGGHARGRW